MQIAASFNRVCALDATGKIWCWGARQNATRTPTPEALDTTGAPSTYTQLIAGDDHFCALSATGSAWCWGNDTYGQLGNGSGAGSSAVPIAVDASEAYTSISGGTWFTCAVDTSGAAWCWGRNANGQLGDGTITQRQSPVRVDTTSPRPSTYSQIFAGNGTSCALTSEGAAWCWGGDYSGELGNGGVFQAADATAPVAVSTTSTLPDTYKSLAGGKGRFCGIASDDSAWCWGWDGSGRLGDGSLTATGSYAFVPSPVDTAGASPDTYGALSATGYHSCGLSLADGAAFCWGPESYGELGDGDPISSQASPSPVATTGILPDGYAQIAANDYYACALATDGGIWCWGRDEYGTLGQGSSVPGVNRTSPVKVTAWPPPETLTVALAGTGTGTVTSSPAGIACGATCSYSFPGGSSVTLTATSSAGSDFAGWSGGDCSGIGDCIVTLSDATTITATFESSSAGWASVSAGQYNSCALTSGGVAYCWGADVSGSLGNGGSNTSTGTPTPVLMPSGKRFSSISVGTYLTCALDQSGGAWCWGRDPNGQLGNGLPATDSTIPVAVTLPTGTIFTGVSAGGEHACASGSDGKAYCWGRDVSGQVGDGGSTPEVVAEPVAVSSIANVSAVSAGFQHSCALTTSGAVWCWGGGGSGGLGNGSQSNQTSPVPVTIGKTITQLEAGFSRTCARASDGTAYCWGDDGQGGVGDGGSSGSAITSPATVVLPIGRTLRQVSTRSGGHSCAVASDGGGYCWGDDFYGQLGNGSEPSDNQSAPYAVAMPTDVSFTDISAGGTHACARAAGGTVYCWGSDQFGQLGDGTIQGGNRTEPYAVAAPTAGHALEVSVVGAGAVISQPSGVSCSSSCSTTFDHGLQVVLSATPSSGATFTGWSGDCVVSGNECTVAMTAARSVTATFSTGWMQVASGDFTTCALDVNGKPWCWGFLFSGSTRTGTPTAVDTTSAPTTYRQLTAGNDHFCAIATDWTAWCWGYDTYGQLGNGAGTTTRSVPVAVVGGASYYRSISGGNGHTCAIATGGAAYCWGKNTAGQVGDGTKTDNQSPVAVTTGGGRPSSYTSVVAGDSVSCGISLTGAVWCWGTDGNGELGNGDEGTVGVGDADVTAPIAVSTAAGRPSSYERLTANDGHVCGIASDHTAWCWGWDGTGRLGDGASTVTGGTAFSPSAVDTSGGRPATYSDISADGRHTCGLSLVDGSAWCWGNDSAGQLGNGATTADQVSPSAVSTTDTIPDGYAQISIGDLHSCALTGDRTIWCWGDNQQNGQIGQGGSSAPFSPASSAVPLAVTSWPPPLLLTVTFAGAGSGTVTSSPAGLNCSATCSYGFAEGSTAILTVSPAAGSDFAGWSGSGCSGTGTCAVTLSSAASVTATFVSAAAGWTEVSAGQYSTCALAVGGVAYCWGDDTEGGLGNGGADTDTGTPTPVAMPPGERFTQVTTGTYIGCALDATGDAWCWGWDEHGQLGNGSPFASASVPMPVTMPDGVTFTSISAGRSHVCASGSDGKAYCWGVDSSGQIGNGAGSSADIPAPVEVSTLTGVALVSVGFTHSCALTSSGAVWCWGAGGGGGLGTGDTTNQSSPVAITIAKTITWLDAGFSRTCARASDGTAYCWGDDGHGAVGDGSGSAPSGVLSPAVVSSPVGRTFRQVSTGLGAQSCGVADNGAGYCWGYDGSGELGNGAAVTGDKDVPYPVSMPVDVWFTQVSTGGQQTCARAVGGTLYCWGGGNSGEVGDGTVGGSSQPAPHLVAAFSAPQALTLTFAGAQSGSASSQPSDLSCSANCSVSFAYGLRVVLTATPASGATATWTTGCDSVSGNQCTVAMTSARAVTVTFAAATSTLTVSTAGGGTITSDIGGIACGATCSASITNGTTVTLTGTPDSGASFGIWTGCTPVQGTPNQCTVTVNSATPVSATFTYPLSVTISGSGSVTFSTGDASCSATCSQDIDYGTSVTMTATAATGSSFGAWSVCPSTSTNQCTVSMTASRSVTVAFTLNSYSLLVQLSGAGGSVTSDPAGISCGVTCSASFQYGSSVRLQASVTTGYTFVGWSENCTPVQGDPTKCDVVIGTSNTVTATFSSTSVPVSVSVSGQGSGSVTSSPAGISCTATCSASFTYGDSVTLTAAPAAGSTFAGWSGGCEGTGSCTVDAGIDPAVGAVFDRTPYPLTVVVSGPGTVTSSPAGISACDATCSFTFPYAQTVTLTASAVGEGSSFKGWSPNCTPTGTFTCTISVTAAKTVSAFFASSGDTVGLAASGPEVAATGGLITFTVTVSNFTETDITGATLTAATTLQVSTAGCSGTGPYTCALPTLAPGSRTFKVYATAPAAVGSASATFTVVPPTPPSDSVTSNNTATVTVPVESDLLSLKVGTYPSSSSSGALLSYTVDIRNGSGVTTATGLVLHVGFDDAGVATSGAACSLDPISVPGYAASVSCPLTDLATSTTRSLLFQIYGPATVSGTLLHATLWVTSADTGDTDTLNDTDGPFETDVSPPPVDGAATVTQAVEVPTTTATDISTVTQDGLSSTDQTGTQLSLPGGFLGTVESQEVKEIPSARVAADLSFSIQGGLSTARGRPIKPDPTVFSCTGEAVYAAECWRFDIRIEESVAASFVYTFTFLFDGSAFTASSGTLLGIKNVAFFHKGDELNAIYVLVPGCPRKTTAASYPTNVPDGGPCLVSKKVNAAGDYVFVVLTDTNGQWKGGR